MKNIKKLLIILLGSFCLLSGINATIYNQDNNFDLLTSQTITGSYGLEFIAKNDGWITNVYKSSISTATECHLFSSTGILIKSGSFSGNICLINVSILNSNTYYIEASNGESSYTMGRDNSVTYPVSNSYINWTYSSHNGIRNSDIYAFNIQSIDFDDLPLTPTIQTNIQDYYNSQNISIQLNNSWTSTGDLNEDLVFSDFTNTNLELNGNFIQLKSILNNYNSVTGALIGKTAYFINGGITTANQVCIELGGTRVSHTTKNAGTTTQWFYSDSWTSYSSSELVIDSITCNMNYYSTGNLIKTFILTKDLNQFSLTDIKNLNSQTLTSKLIYNNTEFNFNESGILNLNVSSGSTIQLKYYFFSNGLNTPQLSDINFKGTNINKIPQIQMSYILDEEEKIIIGNHTNYNLFLNFLSEGSHSIIFEAVDENGQTNTTANFTIDLTNPAINIFNTSEINSYLINWTQHFNYSDTNLDSCQVTVENLTQNCSNYNFAENGNQTIQIDVNDSAGNSVTDSYIQLVNPNQYFRIYDTARALYVENYSFGNYNSSDEYVTIPLYDLGLGNHSLQFSKFGYNQENFKFNFNLTSVLNQTFNGTAVTITIKVYDESSPTTQLNFNLSMNNISNYTQYLNQLNFEKYYNEILTGNLTFTAESFGYSLRKVFTELNPYSTVSHIIYLLADEDSTPVVFRTLNLAQTQAIEDVVFTFKKEISGLPTFLGQAKTDSQGYTYFNMDVSTDYEITISKSGYISQVINSIPGKTDYTILMEEEGSTNSFLFDDFSYIINPQLTPDSVPFNASVVVFDESNLISSMQFAVTGDNTSKTQALTTSSGGTIEFEITNSSSQYVLNLTVMREGQEYSFIKKLNYYDIASSNATIEKVTQELEGNSNNENRVFMIIIIYIVAVVLGSLFSPTIGAICGLFPITIFAIPTIGWITPGIAALFYLFTILGVLYFER